MKYIRIAAGILCVFSLFFTCFYGAGRINSANEKLTEAEKYKGIITIWQVDSFEGGTGSRAQFLLRAASITEKRYKGVLFSVENKTLESAKEDFAEGRYPDILSSGNGVDFLKAVGINSDKSFAPGEIGGVSYCLPWCRGGYVLITNEKAPLSDVGNEILISKGDYTQPLLALIEEGINVTDYKTASPMDAYVEFVAGKARFFLGTQRDVNRLTRRGMEVTYAPLSAYNDLYQYVAITTSDPQKKFYAERFIEDLLSEKVQNKLSEIGMMSAYYRVEEDIPILNDMQKLNGFSTLSPFTSPSDLEEIFARSERVLKGEEDIKNLKKILL